MWSDLVLAAMLGVIASFYLCYSIAAIRRGIWIDYRGRPCRRREATGLFFLNVGWLFSWGVGLAAACIWLVNRVAVAEEPSSGIGGLWVLVGPVGLVSIVMLRLNRPW